MKKVIGKPYTNDYTNTSSLVCGYGIGNLTSGLWNILLNFFKFLLSLVKYT